MWGTGRGTQRLGDTEHMEPEWGRFALATQGLPEVLWTNSVDQAYTTRKLSPKSS
jgi:hypothetical protein